MKMNYNVTGEERKELVRAIEAITGWKAVYKGMPSMAFAIKNFTVTRDGTLEWDDRTPESEAELLVEQLLEKGYEPVIENEDKLSISVPADSLDEKARKNLDMVVKVNAGLLKKAIGTDSLKILYGQDGIRFPWFKADASGEESHAYMTLIELLCEFARNQKRVNMKEKAPENEKYAFRCFLLRLGFIGAEYKTDRKILLRNLIGSAAFKNPEEKENTVCSE